MKIFTYIFFLLWLTSCGYRTLEGRVKPVYFSTDPVIFNDTLSRMQAVLYQNLEDLSNPCLEMVELQKARTVKTFIARPTFFWKDNIKFLVYPKEHIFITASDTNYYSPTFSTLDQNKVRDGEFLVLKTFQKLEKRPKIPLWLEYNFQKILDAEKTIRAEIAPAERTSQLIFDSLCNAYHVSKKFKRLTKDYVHNRYDVTVLSLYLAYRDTLLAHDVYYDKVKALLPKVNGCTKTSQFNLNVEQNTNALYTWMFPDRGIRNMTNQIGGLQACFDSVVANFTGAARDYLLSRIMYRAYTQGSSILPNYRRAFRHYSMNKDYRKIIARVAKQVKHSKTDSYILPNELLTADEKTKIMLEDVLGQYKGKYVLLDV